MSTDDTPAAAPVLRVAHVSSEVAPWAKSGGLGDVLGALPPALHALGDVQVATFCPLHRAVRKTANQQARLLEDTGVRATLPVGEAEHSGRWLVHRAEGQPPVYFLEEDGLFDRADLYTAYEQGTHGSDNGRRFAFFARAALQAAPELMGGPLDVLHAHDWQGAPALLYLKGPDASAHPGTRGVLTIHNLAYQGIFRGSDARALGLELDADLQHPGEPHLLNLLKGGIGAADAVTTVSPRYAEEITTPAFGQGLDAWLRARAAPVRGILNGIDTDEWDPSRDLALPATYSAEALSGKATCRRQLLRDMGLPADGEDLVLGLVSRMVSQKGLDLVLGLVPHLERLRARLVVLGTGAWELEDAFRAGARAFPDRLAARIAFKVPLSHRITAGADAFLVPSRFEPCGLTQLYALRYGTVPIVHAVGGLADTVRDPGDAALARGEGTGFCFHEPSSDALIETVARAARLFHGDPEGWRRLQLAGMGRDSSWAPSAERYRALYRELTG